MTLDEEGWNNFLNQVMSIWINPEIEKRKKDQNALQNFTLYKAQVLLPSGERAIVRLNEEVLAQTSYKLNSEIKEGQVLYPKNVDDKPDIKLSEFNPNYGHITLILSGDKWVISIDLRTNKALNHERQVKGEEYMIEANESFENTNKFLTDIKNAVKIFVTNIMCSLYGEKWLQDKAFETLRDKYFEFIDLGNHEPEFKNLINTLYVSIPENEKNETKFTKKECNSILALAKELGEYSRRMSC